MFRPAGCLLFVWLCSWPASGVEAVPPTAHWIWHRSDRNLGQQVCLFTRHELTLRPATARLRGVAGYCRAVFYVNGRPVGAREPYEQLLEIDVADQLVEGQNTLGVSCRSVDGPAAVFLQLDLEFDDGRQQTIVTDERWCAGSFEGASLRWPAIGNIESTPVASFGGVARFPWGDASDSITVRPLDDYTQWKRVQGTSAATDPATFEVPAGFELELLRSARKNEDSWVAMAFDPKGRIVIAKEKHGLLRITLPATPSAELHVEEINKTLRECRGLLFADGSLYVMANNDKGFFRLRDTDGDDRFDEVELLKTFAGDVGHGRNQLVLGPDNMIYAIFGDAVYEPEGATVLPPTLSRPTAAEKTRSGFLARTNFEGRDWQVLVRGLRNPFGIAFNSDGEPFTYDADAEYDMGSPWYRPTRVDHLVWGADFGWRRVTKQWPPYVPDRPDIPQPTLDIGKGSPTAVAFGTGSHFPLPYSNALYILDWAYGRVLAVHLSPYGSSYAAKAETFVRGRPANVTDIEFGPDGAMYFVTGGRGTQSALYRVRYTGPAVQSASLTQQQHERARHASRSRRLRKSLESLLARGESNEVIEHSWPHLGSDDPWIRHAARAAIEWQPFTRWQQKALDESRPWAALEAMLALTRVGPHDATAAVVARLNELPLQSFSEQQKSTALFVYERCLDDVRSSEHRSSILVRLNKLYPAASDETSRRLNLLLGELDAPDFVERTIRELERTTSQRQQMHYLFVLRNIKDGWTANTRSIYFDHLRRSGMFIGGAGMPTFRRLIEDEALATLPDSERQRYEKQLRAASDPWAAEIPSQARPLVRRWTTADLDGSNRQLLEGRDFARGKRMFAVAKCIACHRVGDRGGVLGPDLSSVSARFTPRDVLVSVLEPSRVVAEKYRSETFVLEDGRTISGRIVPGGDYRSATLRVSTDPLDPTKFVEFPKASVELHKPSPMSPMPKGLVDTLTKDELLDLLAYINAAGRADHPSYRQ